MTYNGGPDFTRAGYESTTCSTCNESIHPEWNGHDGIWFCPICDAEQDSYDEEPS